MFDPGTLIQHVNVRSLIAMYICNSMSIRLILGERYANLWIAACSKFITDYQEHSKSGDGEMFPKQAQFFVRNFFGRVFNPFM
jgi:hypothetical protein